MAKWNDSHCHKELKEMFKIYVFFVDNRQRILNVQLVWERILYSISLKRLN